MLATFFHYVGDFFNVFNRRLHLKLVTNIFWLQHPSPTSMSPSMLKVILPFTCPKSKRTSFTLSSCWVSIDQLETLVSDFYQYQNESMINSWFWSLRSSQGSIGQSMGLPSWEFRPLYAEPWLKSWKVLAMSFTSVLYTECKIYWVERRCWKSFGILALSVHFPIEWSVKHWLKEFVDPWKSLQKRFHRFIKR